MIKKCNQSNESSIIWTLQLLGFFVVWMFMIFITSCTNDDKKNTQVKSLRIVTTTGMIGELLKNIVKDKAEVKSMMGAGVDPHLYKATPNDLQMLRDAHMVFYNGLHLEGKMAEVLEKLGKQKPVLAVADGLDKSQLRKSMDNSDAIDPHIWFDVLFWKKISLYLGDKLAQFDKKNADFYKNNAQDYANSLENLHQSIQKQIQTIPKERRVLITAHDAFGYFGAAYDIEVRGLQGISTVSEFGLKDVADLVNFIVKRKIKAVFVETSISQKSLESVVRGCEQKGHPIKIGGTLFSDAMGEAGTSEGTYLGMVQANVNTIVGALR